MACSLVSLGQLRPSLSLWPSGQLRRCLRGSDLPAELWSSVFLQPPSPNPSPKDLRGPERRTWL